MALTQLPGTAIADGTMTDADLSPSANIAISKINGLQAALDGKADIGSGSAEAMTTLSSVVNINCSAYTLFNITLAGNAAISVTSVPANTILNFIISSNYAITVTMPAGGYDYKNVAAFTIAIGHKRIVSLVLIGSYYHWIVSEELI